MKICSSCKIEKSSTEYYAYKRGVDGLQSKCKGCHAEYYRAHYNANKDAYNERAARDFQVNKSAYYNRKYTYRQSLRSDKLELTDDEKARVEEFYWLAGDLQAVTGEPYEVDHIIPISKGGKHHPDNLQVLPRDLNRSKGNKL